MEKQEKWLNNINWYLFCFIVDLLPTKENHHLKKTMNCLTS